MGAQAQVKLNIVIKPIVQINVLDISCQKVQKALEIEFLLDTFSSAGPQILKMEALYLNPEKRYFLIKDKARTPILERQSFMIRKNIVGSKRDKIRISILDSSLEECDNIKDMFLFTTEPI